MLLGIDAGTSAVKLAVLDGEKIVLTHYERNRGSSMETLNRALWNSGARDLELTAAAVTGLNGNNCHPEEMGLPIFGVSEIDAIGRGGRYLGGLDRAMIVNLGSGSTFVLADGDTYTHLGGTGVGGGTLIGLGRRLLGIDDPAKLAELAAEGDLAKVDLRIGDLFGGSETLQQELTASNLAKFDPDATDADWAAGLFNLVLQSVGTMAILACGGRDLQDIVLLGGLALQPFAIDCFGMFNRMYPQRFFIADDPACATALGAALLLKENEPQWTAQSGAEEELCF
ncbi:MAG: pantothenate kinase [Oscillospiraceae bacterium]|nr:pantothenate kinase [Oscillospiraceae bacterium]